MINQILEKSVWTHEDFNSMGWHDAAIYGMAFEKIDDFRTDLLLDIDYIFAWVNPIPPSNTYTFWVSPCTLIFKDIRDFKIEYQKDEYLDDIEIADINMICKPCPDKKIFYYEWNLDLHIGKITLKSEGYMQIVKQLPAHVTGQKITMQQRGGINFSKKPC